MLLNVGEVIDGYQILSLIGVGGMGEVFKVRHIASKAVQAMKVMSPAQLGHPQVVARFRKEIALLSRLDHPNIVAVHAAGEHGGLHYFVQDLVAGIDLCSLVKHHGALDAQRTTYIGIKVAQALAHIHAADLLHRDLKPANVMITRRGDVKVMDFGLALDIDGTRLTETGGVVGTLAYLPPDVLEGAEFSPAVDCYQLGCILYELVTGVMLVPNNSYIELGFIRLRHRLRTMDDLTETTPAALAGAIRRACAADPNERFPSASAFEQALLVAEDKKVTAATMRHTTEVVEALVQSSTSAAAAAPAEAALAEAAPERPVHEQSTATLRTKLPALFVAAVLLLAAYLVATRPASTPRKLIRNFVSRSHPTTIEVQWMMPRPVKVEWQLTLDGVALRSGTSRSDGRRHTVVIDDCTPGVAYRLVLSAEGRELFSYAVETPAVEIAGQVYCSRVNEKPVLELGLSIPLSHAVPTGLRIDHKALSPMTCAASSSPAFDFALPADEITTAALPFELTAAGLPIAEGSFGLGPRAVFSSFRGESKALGHSGLQRGDRYRRLSDYLAPYRFTVDFVPAGGKAPGYYFADRNGYVYEVGLRDDHDYWELRWAACLPPGAKDHDYRPRAIVNDSVDGLIVFATDETSATCFRLNRHRRRQRWRPGNDGAAFCKSASWQLPWKDHGEWRRNLPGVPVDDTNIHPHLTLANGDLLLSRSMGLWRINLRTMKARWAKRLKVLGDSELSRFTVRGERLYVVGRCEESATPLLQLVAIDLTTGDVAWAQPLARSITELREAAPLVVEDDLLYCGAGKTLYCLEGVSGMKPKVRWTYDLPYFILGAPCIGKDRLAFFMGQQKLSFNTDLYRMVFTSLALGDNGPTNMQRYDLEHYQLRHDVLNDSLEPFWREGIFYFSYANILYGFDEGWQLITRDPLRGRIRTLPKQLPSRHLMFTTIEGYVQVLAPNVTVRSIRR